MRYEPTRPELWLRSLVPIGLATCQVESVESYLWRLAIAHDVPVLEVKKLVLNQHTNVHVKLLRPDAPNLYSLRLAEALPAMTRRLESGTLGLGRLHGQLSPTWALKKHRSWCPECVSEMTCGAYWPLSWSLIDYNFCGRHSRELSCSCPACGQQFDTQGDWLPVERTCPRCGEDVCSLERGAHQRGGDFKPHIAEFQMCQRIEEFCTVVGSIPLPQTVEASTGVTRALDLIRNLYPDVEERHLMQLAGVITLSGGRQKSDRSILPSFSCAARLSMLSGVPIAGLLYEPYWAETRDRVPISELERIQLPHGRLRVDHVKTRKTVLDVIEASHVTSQLKLANTLGVPSTSLRAILGDELNRIAMRRLTEKRRQLRRA
jgi:hypothetical protein